MTFARPRKSAAPLNAEALFDYAVKALGRSMRTEAELLRRLETRVEADESGQARVNAVVARLREYGYLDDKNYAETYTRLRQENEKLGARRVRQSLTQKGVARAVVDEAIAARYDEKDETKLVREHLERKRIARPTNEKETARVLRRLVAAGFTPAAIFKVLRAWNVDDEQLAGLDSIELDDGDEHGQE